MEEQKQVAGLAKTKQIQLIDNSNVQMRDSEHAIRKRANPFIHLSSKVTNLFSNLSESRSEMNRFLRGIRNKFLDVQIFCCSCHF